MRGTNQIVEAAEGISKVIEAGESGNTWPVYVISLSAIALILIGLYFLVRDFMKNSREREREARENESEAERAAREARKEFIEHLREENKDLRNRKL